MERQTLGSSSASSSNGGSIINPALPPEEDAWLSTYNKLLPPWHSLASSYQSAIPISISRVNQVDAARLDIEMSAMLKEQLVKVFSLMKPGMLFQYEPELDAFLEFLIWRFSIWVDKPTPGNTLMNLRYRDERAVEVRGKVRTGLEGPGLTVSQKIWCCVATVGGQYMLARLQSFSAFRRWGDSEQVWSFARRAWLLIQRMEGIYKAASFSNLLLFLYTGRYRNLIERALRARLVYRSPIMNRAVSFEYMNRQLVWNEFSIIFHPLVECCRLYMVIPEEGSIDDNLSENLCLRFCYQSSVRKEVLNLIKKGKGPRKNIPLFLFYCYMLQRANRSCFPTCVSLLLLAGMGIGMKLEELLLLLLPLLNSSSVKNFIFYSQKINLQILQWMTLCAQSAKESQPFHF